MSAESKLQKAENFAREKHKCQLRRDCKTPYSEHLKDVVDNLKKIGVNGETVLCAGWLHDTIEDTTTDYDDIAGNFGIEVADIVVELTKDKRLPEEKREREYIKQLEHASAYACLIKFCDIWANIVDLPSGYTDQEKRVDKVNKKLHSFEAIVHGLKRSSESYGSNTAGVDIQTGIEELNKVLTKYGKRIAL